MAKAIVRPRDHSRYGMIPDLSDHRDLMYSMRYGAQRDTPPAADLTTTKGYFPVYDQGRIGSCTGNGIAAALEFDALIQGTPIATPSRLFIYYFERAIEGTTSVDSGGQIRDGIKVVNQVGAPAETEWPYLDDGKTFRLRPSAASIEAAKMDVSLTYNRLLPDPTLKQMRSCIGVDGRPFVLGFSVYESFESQQVAETGVATMPQPGEQLMGGHCVLAVGYDDSKQLMKCRNSWGSGWGQDGHFWLPYGYLVTPTLSSDFWVIKTTQVEQPAA